MPLLETKGAASAQGFGEFAKVGGPVYIEDVFQTWLYTGNSSTQTITNGIDLSTKGGLVWIKSRSTAGTSHSLYDTSRGVQKVLNTNASGAQATQTDGLTTFNTNGFVVSSNGDINESPRTYASWTFREQAKFFDIVTYTGNGATTQTINHSLGAVPGCIIAKGTSNATDWPVYHRSLNGGTTPEQWYLRLNATSAESNAVANWGNVAPTSTTFTVGANNNVNGYSYVAYLFAHDAGGFGLTGADNVISCGSYTGTGVAGVSVSLGYEPQWVMIKRSSTGGTGNWFMLDTMRGFVAPNGNGSNYLLANLSNAETPGVDINVTATGFVINTTGASINESGQTYIYIAIRRGPMKVPTSGTSVFSPQTATGNGTSNTFTTNFPVDLSIDQARTGTATAYAIDRLRGGPRYLVTQTTAAEANFGSDLISFDSNTTIINRNWGSVNTQTYVDWMFRRAPSFFDIVCYAGTSVTQNISHNLTVVPELIITKRRSTVYAWFCYSATGGADKYIVLNTNTGFVTDTGPWNNTSPTSSVFTVGNFRTNFSGETYVAYLFATCPGVSKVGSYTGTGALQTVNCGFTGGARFVLIKRTDSTGDWYVYDSARGITSGSDPYLLLNSTAAEVTGTNYVDTDTTGFKVTAAAPAELNASGGTYIFLAIA